MSPRGRRRRRSGPAPIGRVPHRSDGFRTDRSGFGPTRPAPYRPARRSALRHRCRGSPVRCRGSLMRCIVRVRQCGRRRRLAGPPTGSRAGRPMENDGARACSPVGMSARDWRAEARGCVESAVRARFAAESGHGGGFAAWGGRGCGYCATRGSRGISCRHETRAPRPRSCRACNTGGGVGPAGLPLLPFPIAAPRPPRHTGPRRERREPTDPANLLEGGSPQGAPTIN